MPLGLWKPRRREVSTRSYNVAEQAPHNETLRHWTDVPLEDIPQVPGMTQDDELKYFYWCCATQHLPGRRVVELGPYVGRSTVALAAGLRRSADPYGKLVSIDRFQWEPWMFATTFDYIINCLSDSQRAKLTRAQLNAQENDSFLPIFQMFTKPLKDSIEVVDASLESYQWRGEPIDVLMVDAAKSWEAMDQIVRQFFPCLVDGAVVIHQDYKHAFTYWLHVVSERMIERGVLTSAENVHRHPTQGFRFHKRADFRIDDYLQSAFSDTEADELIARSATRFESEYERLAVIGARCQLLKDQGRYDRAKRVFEQAILDGGFADYFPLIDLLTIDREWARLLAPTLAEQLIVQPGIAAKKYGPRAVGQHSIAIPIASNGAPQSYDVASLDTAGCSTLALNFWADAASADPIRLRIHVSDSNSVVPFFDQEFNIPPASYQAVSILLNGRSSVAMRWTVSTALRSGDSRKLHCIAPMLLTDA